MTISLEEKNRDEIESILKTMDVDWDIVVKVSTSHYVFPALYCNFKRADFLKYLPADLVDYMKQITNLNRDRNTQIIQQAQELNILLLANNIRPIFLKGTGNLLEGLYEDVGERMIGDIDFLFSEEDFSKAIDVLKKDKSLLNKYIRSKKKNNNTTGDYELKINTEKTIKYDIKCISMNGPIGLIKGYTLIYSF